VIGLPVQVLSHRIFVHQWLYLVSYYRFTEFFSRQRFAVWRRNTGLTYREVAFHLNVAASTVRRYEIGTSDPSDTVRIKIAALMQSIPPLELPLVVSEDLPLTGGIDDDICRLLPLRAVDGDTIEVRCDVTRRNWIVRAIGFDAYEATWTYKLPPEFYEVEQELVTRGRIARLWLQECIAASTSVTLMKHPFMEQDRDHFDRKLRCILLNNIDIRTLLPEHLKRSYSTYGTTIKYY
jgi:transcriptional regulator with XRE-family HTH domain